jgi:AcrR family transcriptional regulator
MNATDTSDLIAAAAIQLAGRNGWRSATLAEIAAEAGVTLAELAQIYSSRPDILDGFEKMIDRRMLAGATAGIDDQPRDRMFEIVMARLDALAPYREGAQRIAGDLPFDPQSGLVMACALPRSISWMFAGANLPLGGPLMPLKLAAVGAAYLSTFRIWLNDDSEDLSKTMATLDRNMDRVKDLLGGEHAKAAPQEDDKPTD